MNRPSRDKVMMQTAQIWSERSTCRRAKIGAVLAVQGRIISTGYVGVPSGEEHCDQTNCKPNTPCERTLHAESNTLDFAALYGISPFGATLYTTRSPCLECAKRIVNVHIKRVVYLDRYRELKGLEYLQSRITVEQMFGFEGV